MNKLTSPHSLHPSPYLSFKMQHRFMRDLLLQLAHPKHDPSESDTGSKDRPLVEQMESELHDMIKDLPDFHNRDRIIREKFDALRGEIALEIFEKLKEVIHSIGQNEITPHVEQHRQTKAKKTTASLEKYSMEKNILASMEIADLRISYHILKPDLKLCLLCFSVFPEKSVIKVRSMVYWWMGEGLVKDEKTATDYCKELMEIGMIEPVMKNSCAIHPWIQRMVCSVAKEAELFDFDDSGMLTNDFTASRRAFLLNDNKTGIGKPQDLITLYNIDTQYLEFKRHWFSTLKRMVVLQLGRWHSVNHRDIESTDHHIEVHDTDFLKGLNRQTQLRYISLQGISRITELPDSIGSLTNVRILDLRACHNLEKLPSGVTSMKKLTHLDVSECYLLEYMPKGFQYLSELQVLKGFLLCDSKRKHSCRLSELAKLKKLRKLSIHVLSPAAELELGELKEVGSLCILTIIWGKDQENSKERSAEETEESSSIFPQKLEKLEIQCFPRRYPPHWLIPSALPNLKKLYIRGGVLETLGGQAESWGIKVLQLKFLKNFIDLEQLEKAFPNAKKEIVYPEEAEKETVVQ